jgi:type I restriction enzyme R subunit
MRPGVVLDILQNFTLFATDKKHRRIKVICRYQQYETTNKMIARVVAGYPRKGLIWHFQGSGKSLLMVFAAQKLRMHPRLGNPTVLIVVDRIDLDTQITATFNAADVPNMVGVSDRKELQKLINQDVRKVLITTIHKFGEAEGKWNDRKNIIVMVDEAHRTQEGDLGRKMREALPNAFLFGLTGTPINRADRNTFWAFGANEDTAGYLSRYSFQDSIRDKATLPLHFEAPTVKLKIDKAAIDEAYKEITGDLSEQDRDDLAKRAAKMAVLVKNPERVRAVVEHIVQHYQTKVEPNGFKAQVVCFDRECCVRYKTVMDEIIGPDASAIVMSAGQKDPPAWSVHLRDKDAEEKLLDRFRDPADPLKFVIVTSKLLTGFDAPILQAMYLDKPMKDHNLLQAICRVNRTYGQMKTHGLIVDYIGIFDDVAQALDFDEKAVQQVVSNIDELRKALPVQVQKCLAFFPGVDRSVGGYEGLMEAQQHLPNNETRDKFAGEYSVLGTIWEALSPDPCLGAYATDYKWLTQVYESVKPVSGNGKLLWHRLGAKTIELINENVHVEAVNDDLDALVLDADILDGILGDANPAKKAKEVEIKLIARLRKHAGNPKFKALGERLEKIKERHEQGLLNSLEFLKAILEIAKEVVEAENQIDPEEEQDRALAALTELFNEVKNQNTHVIVERIVADIDGIVKQVRFDGWQATAQGEREVKQALRRALLRYKLHSDQELFDKAYGYIREYY